RLQLCSDLLPHIIKDNAENKFLNLFDLIRYKTLDLINEDNILFISKEKFEEMIEKGEFLEYAQIYDNFYGTPKAAIMECLEKG
ncbi:guanylate kinase, partial [Clostridioides difficile]